jgi:two-component system cell cycle sensor histidine kinase/response regulator CckA
MTSLSLEPLSVLVVDDDGLLLRTLSDILKRRGYSPLVASSGREGLDLAEHSLRPPAIALVDLRLPDMDGLDVIGRLRSLSELTETVILTGHASVDSAVRALREHSCDYLVKPVPPDKLLSTIERAGERWQRRHAEEALRQSEERSRLLLEHISDAVLVLEPTLVIRFANPSCERIFGDQPSSLVGRPLRDWLHPDDGDLLESFLRTTPTSGNGGTHALEVRALSPDGAWRIVEIAASNLQHRPEIAGIVLTARDVTERRRLEADLRQAQKMDSVGRLAGGVAHDFNNILSVIVGYSELLLARTWLDDDVRVEIGEILRAGEHAGRLTRQLLAFARRQPSEPRVLSVNALVEDLSRMLARLIGEDIHMHTVLEPRLALVRVDRGQIEQVVVNLAVNARDAMPHGGTLAIETRNVHVERESDEATHAGFTPGDYTVLSIRDTGTGMTDQVRSQAFEPFFTTKEFGRGTGLGLATCYGIVSKAGGYIAIESVVGQGTTIHIYLPAVEAPIDPPPALPLTQGSARGSETVLVVDDDAAVREFVVKALDAYGYTVLEARDVAEAVQTLERRPEIRLTVADVVLSGASGVELAEIVKTRFTDVKVLFMSGYEERAALAPGVIPITPLLQKPFSLTSLARSVRDVLDAR